MSRRYEHPAPSLEERVERLEDTVRWLEHWVTLHNIRDTREGKE